MKWEYLTINIYPYGTLDEHVMDRLGQNGWELAAAYSPVSGQGLLCNGKLIFKRPVPENLDVAKK